MSVELQEANDFAQRECESGTIGYALAVKHHLKKPIHPVGINAMSKQEQIVSDILFEIDARKGIGMNISCFIEPLQKECKELIRLMREKRK